MKASPNHYCRLHNGGAIDEPCKDQCIECGVKHYEEQQKAIMSEIDTNLVNAYTCGTCQQNTVIKHREKGVTPFMMDCFHCGNKAVSHMYKVPQDLEHHIVAFKPRDKAEWKMYRNYLKSYYRNEPEVDSKLLNIMIASAKQHVQLGGVVMVSADKLKIN